MDATETAPPPARTAIPYRSQGQFGFTNDPTVIEAVRQWRDAAIADGWVEKDMDNDSRRRRSRLERDGWVAHTITRDDTDKASRKWAFEASINLWAPDRLAVVPPPIYDFAAMVAGTRRCTLCKAQDVDTQRYSFAGRCCAACRPEAARKYESGNWTA